MNIKSIILQQDFVKVSSLVIFILAILHVFCAKFFNTLSVKYSNNKIKSSIFHYLGEIEVVFGLWAIILLTILSFVIGYSGVEQYLGQVSYSEAVFVFIVMVISSTKPIINFADKVISYLAKLIPLPRRQSLLIAIFILGPLLGSLITEPAAMTVNAILLKKHFFDDKNIPNRLKYLMLAVLLVNISVGGSLTNFAAPPVLVVSSAWDWSSSFMFKTFGWRAILAIYINTIILAMFMKKYLKKEFFLVEKEESNTKSSLWWVTLTQFIFLTLVILTHQNVVICLTIFLLFIAWYKASIEYQQKLNLEQALLVGFFLGGLVTLGGLQEWWLKPLFSYLQEGQLVSFMDNETILFAGATGLTAIVDNAALTFLGTQVPNLSDTFKYALVSGALVGGGLTVIANAPNPAGVGILKSSFTNKTVSIIHLFLAAILPTIITGIIFFI